MNLIIFNPAEKAGIFPCPRYNAFGAEGVSGRCHTPFIDINKGIHYTSCMGKGTPAVPVGKVIIAALITALLIKLFMFDFMIAEGHSMQPAIVPGKVLLVFKLRYGLRLPGSGTYLLRWATPGIGDIVVFITPWGEIAVKRCSEIYMQNNFYALGDNSLQSYDSRSYGPVPVDNIVGKVLGIR